MAGLTKEERAKREAAEKERLRKEIEEQIRSEMASSINTKNDNDLKKENEELRSQLTQMMSMIKELQSKKVESKKKASTDVTNDKFENIEDVEMNARILVTSMTTGGVNMKTSNDGSARHFRLEKIGQTIPIIYEHLINCINTDRWLFEDGLVYISDANVVREQCLEDAYKKFLTPEKIEHILDFDIDTIKEMVTSTTSVIQETIVDIVASQMNNGGSIDMNKVDAIGKSCNPQVDIRELANKLR